MSMTERSAAPISYGLRELVSADIGGQHGEINQGEGGIGCTEHVTLRRWPARVGGLELEMCSILNRFDESCTRRPIVMTVGNSGECMLVVVMAAVSGFAVAGGGGGLGRAVMKGIVPSGNDELFASVIRGTLGHTRLVMMVNLMFAKLEEQVVLPALVAVKVPIGGDGEHAPCLLRPLPVLIPLRNITLPMP